MRKLMAVIIFIGVLPGCAYTSSIKDGVGVYNRSAAINAPRIALMDLSDSRSNPTHIGQVAALAMKEPKTPINVILTNRIASRLADQGFNVQKIDTRSLDDKPEISKSIVALNATLLVTGNLNDFFVKSFDALMEPANGQISYFVKVIGVDGEVLFEKPYVARASHFIGLTGQFGSDKAVDKTIDAAVDQIFADNEFTALFKTVNSEQAR